MAVAKANGKVIGDGIPGYCKSHVLKIVATIKLLRQQGYSMNKIAKDLRINRRTVKRYFDMLDNDKLLKTRSEMLAEVPIERRGKAFQRSLDMQNGAA